MEVPFLICFLVRMLDLVCQLLRLVFLNNHCLVHTRLWGSAGIRENVSHVFVCYWFANQKVELSILKFVSVHLIQYFIVSMFDCITESNCVVSLDEASIVMLDPCIRLLPTSSIVLLVVGLNFNKSLKVIRALFILMGPEHPNKTTVLPVNSLTYPAFFMDFLHCLISDSSLEFLVISIDPPELISE